MNLNKFMIKDSEGKPSITMTAFVLGFIVINAKLLLSGLTIKGLTMSVFTGSDYGIALSSVGAIYVLRRNKPPKE